MTKDRILSANRKTATELALFLATIVALLLRLFVPNLLLDLFVSYTSDGGLFLVKFHLAAYAIVLALFVALFTRPFVLEGTDISLFGNILFCSGLIVLLTAFIVATNGFGATGFLIDTYLVAMLAGLLLLTQRRQARHKVGEIILIVMILSAFLGIAELLLQKRLMPFVEGEPVFRPTGLTGHPLSLGAQTVLAMGFVPLTRWRLWLKIVMSIMLFIGLAASGARLATLAGAFQIILLLAYSPWTGLSKVQQIKAKIFALLFVMVLGLMVIAGLFAAGFLSRFGTNLFDDNFMARVRIYQVFSLVSWQDIFTGMDAPTLLALVRTRLDLPYIESAPVFIILTLGLPAAVGFTYIVVKYFNALLAGVPVQAKIAGIMYIVVNLSNNGLATKSPDIIFLTVLIIAFRRVAPAVQMRSGLTGPHHVLSTTSSRPQRL
ncbi:VpsF family polysaccharide biosynthesis protein [Rhizobium oryzicola]|uniref:VpsF family polysaccharide biosynthesis protein n=1 Tax=Rhizobium oryzicola TaxID=1232668 RepID=A0ABT8SY16_9HYPH|nr:VpsF family polysaccharide biosynthesis protein [Rhizobium oryzicola]MDO1582788.1 VpsF family polysaccharide biosynthesis protein [Rhizobium oryzicola]